MINKIRKKYQINFTSTFKLVGSDKTYNLNSFYILSLSDDELNIKYLNLWLKDNYPGMNDYTITNIYRINQ